MVKRDNVIFSKSNYQNIQATTSLPFYLSSFSLFLTSRQQVKMNECGIYLCVYSLLAIASIHNVL
jgi:hypothetical protein